MEMPIFVSSQILRFNFSKFIGLYISYSIMGINKPSSWTSILNIIKDSS